MGRKRTYIRRCANLTRLCALARGSKYRNNGDAVEDLSFQFRFKNTSKATALTIGGKTFGSATGYATYAGQHIYNVAIPGCAVPACVFVGQRKEPFFIAVGKAFDLFNLNPLGAESGGNNNDLEAKNVITLALELPISCITNGTDPVIGAFTTASLRRGRLRCHRHAESGLQAC